MKRNVFFPLFFFFLYKLSLRHPFETSHSSINGLSQRKQGKGKEKFICSLKGEALFGVSILKQLFIAVCTVGPLREDKKKAEDLNFICRYDLEIHSFTTFTEHQLCSRLQTFTIALFHLNARSRILKSSIQERKDLSTWGRGGMVIEKIKISKYQISAVKNKKVDVIERIW